MSDSPVIQVEKAKRQLLRLRGQGLDSRAYRLEAMTLLEQHFAVDVTFFGAADPTSMLLTGGLFSDDVLRSVAVRLLENELLEDDFNKFNSLAHSKHLLASLSKSTNREMDRSRRYREILQPLGLGDEIKAALVVDSSVWGYLCLHRAYSGPEFSPTEVDSLRQIIPYLADGLRLAILTDNVSATNPATGPGLIILEDDLTVAAINAPAQHWLDEIAALDWKVNNGLPFSLNAAVTRLQALEREGEQCATVSAALRSASGHWLILHVSRLFESKAAGQISVIIEVARPPEIAPLLEQAYGLSKREQEIVFLVAQGMSTAEISARLFISSHTVQDHLKSIFDKVGVHSRRALVKQLYDSQYSQKP